MPFRVADLALRLEIPSDVNPDLGQDMGFRVVIDCGFQSALNPAGCSGTHPNLLMEGKLLDVPENLNALREKLREFLQELDAAAPVPPGGGGDLRSNL